MNHWAWLALLICTNLLVLGLPMLPALLEWRRHDAQPLHIPGDDESGIEYFALRFRQRLQTDWGVDRFFDAAGFNAAVLAGSPGECGREARPALPSGPPVQTLTPYRIATPGLAISGRPRGHDVNEPVLVGDLIRLGDGSDYLGDIYARSELKASGGSLIRAVLCDGDVVLGPGCGILRWAHARSLRIAHGSRVTGRMSAIESISLGPDCRFERLKAPLIILGSAGIAANAAATDAQPISTPVRPTAAVPFAGANGLRWQEPAGRWSSRGNVMLPDGTFVEGDVIVHGRLRLGANCVVNGSIKGYASIELGSGVQIHGSCFAHGAVALARNCHVDGQLSSKVSISMDDGCMIGRPDHPCSTVAPAIRVVGTCRLHGSIWARDSGRTLAP